MTGIGAVPAGFDVERRRALERMLATGRVSEQPVGYLPSGINGSVGVHEVTDADTGEVVRAARKPVEKGGAHEVFAYQTGVAMAYEHLLAATARRENGDAMIEIVPGREFGDTGLYTPQGYVREVAKGLVKRHGMEPVAAARAAATELQEAISFDLEIANRDRNPRNGLYDLDTARRTWIDHGKMASWKRPRPTYNSGFAVSEGARLLERASYKDLDLLGLPLLPSVRAKVAGTDRSRIVRAFEQLVRDVEGHPYLGDNGVRPDDTWLPKMFATLDEGAAGEISYLARGWDQAVRSGLVAVAR